MGMSTGALSFLKKKLTAPSGAKYEAIPSYSGPAETVNLFLRRTRVQWTCPFWPSTFGLKKDKAQKDAPLGSNIKQFLHILVYTHMQAIPSFSYISAGGLLGGPQGQNIKDLLDI